MRFRREHNRHILAVRDVLDGRSLQDAVDVIACGTGQGPLLVYALRSVAQGLAWAQELPVQGFCSLTAQVYSAADISMLQNDVSVLSTGDAQIDQLYGLWGRWRDGHFVPEGALVCLPEHLPQPKETHHPIIVGLAEDTCLGCLIGFATSRA